MKGAFIESVWVPPFEAYVETSEEFRIVESNSRMLHGIIHNVERWLIIQWQYSAVVDNTVVAISTRSISGLQASFMWEGDKRAR